MIINLKVPDELEEWVKESYPGSILPLGSFYILKVNEGFILRKGNWEEISKELMKITLSDNPFNEPDWMGRK